MERRYRLGEEEGVRHIIRFGRRAESLLFKASFLRNSIGHQRFAFVVSKKVARRAVKRNLLRRRAREWVRKQILADKRPVDVVLFLKKEAAAASRKKFYEELEKFVAKSFW